MAATQPEQPLPARSAASRARCWGARLGAFLLGLWIALYASMCAGAEAAATEGQRIVAVGGELTEIVYALGAEARLVGVDTTSRRLAATGALPKVGYMRTLSAEGVLSLAPTLVLCTTHAGPPVVLAQLREAGVPLLILPAEPNVAGAEAKIRGVAEALGLGSRGEVLVRTLRSAVERALAGISAGVGPRMLFLMGLQQGAPIAAGEGIRHLLGFGPRLGEAITDLAQALREPSTCSPVLS